MFTLNGRGRLISLEKPLVMGIINITPDSFFAGSRQATLSGVLMQAEKMLSEGAAILDLGGQSTRPGAERVSADEESERVVPAVEAIISRFPEAVISVDTFYSMVANRAVEAGALIVNDVSAGLLDADMLQTVARLRVPYICMHMKGEPQTMQHNPQYEDVTREVLDFFIRRIEDCRKAGIVDIIADPGFGFGKTIAHNFELIKNLDVFKILDVPLLMGISRKSTIYKTLGITADEALNGTTVLHTIGLMKGANILRVHDVKEAVEAVKLTGSLGLA
ncbi:MAG: dihydropteroate synthase [Chitinophagaceae bacterium]|nr:dihydropteroate synthase [Chitinophagaceae bacterium]